MSGAEGHSVEVEREKVFVRTPAGRRVRLATQQEFGRAYSELRGELVRANVVADPSYYFPHTRRPCDMQFFAAPGTGIAYDNVAINDRRVCYERFFFQVPGGIQPGRWVLGIDFEESEVRVPFDLRAR